MTDQETLVRGIKTPANLLPYVEVLGVDDAMRLFLAVGGSIIYLPRERPRDNSMAARIIGADKVLALSKRLELDYTKVPVASEWIAQVMRAQGESAGEIARTVRSDVSTVRRWLNAGGDD